MESRKFFQSVARIGMAFSLASVLAFGYLRVETPVAFENSLLSLACFAVLWLLSRTYLVVLNSRVEEHLGACVPVWFNQNQVDYRSVGSVTGFFRKAVGLPGLPFVLPMGPQFHGYEGA